VATSEQQDLNEHRRAYVITRGAYPGVYISWDGCAAQSLGYAGVIFYRATTLARACDDFLEQTGRVPQIYS